MVDGVHFLPDADPADVAWKLVAVNLSDLAAKGAEPLGVLLGFTLSNSEWDMAFAGGLEQTLSHYNIPLLGGDTVSAGGHGRTLGLTALGKANSDNVPSRSGAIAGDALYVTGYLGEALAGLELTKAQRSSPSSLIAAHNRPIPLLAEGRVLAPIVNAMMDVSDGLLLDASRMAMASKLAVQIDLAAAPLSQEYISAKGDGRQQRLEAASGGDDYQLLFAASLETELPIKAAKVGHRTFFGR